MISFFLFFYGVQEGRSRERYPGTMRRTSTRWISIGSRDASMDQAEGPHSRPLMMARPIQKQDMKTAMLLMLAHLSRTGLRMQPAITNNEKTMVKDHVVPSCQKWNAWNMNSAKTHVPHSSKDTWTQHSANAKCTKTVSCKCDHSTLRAMRSWSHMRRSTKCEIVGPNNNPEIMRFACDA